MRMKVQISAYSTTDVFPLMALKRAEMRVGHQGDLLQKLLG